MDFQEPLLILWVTNPWNRLCGREHMSASGFFCISCRSSNAQMGLRILVHAGNIPAQREEITRESGQGAVCKDCSALEAGIR